MGSVLTDYLKCDPAELNFRALALNGFWPLVTTKKWIRNLHVVYCFICNFSVTSMLVIQILDVYLLRHDLLALVKTLSMTSITFMTVTRHHLLTYRMTDIMALHQRLNDIKNSQTDPKTIEIVKKADQHITWTAKTFGYMVLICATVWTFYPLVDAGMKRELMFPYRLPLLDKYSTPVYEILYTYQALSMIGFMSNIIFTDSAFFSFIIRINSLYDVLIQKIGTIGKGKEIDDGRAGEVVETENNPTSTECEDISPAREMEESECQEIREDIKKCVVFHQYILSEIKVLQKIYGMPSLFFFAAVIVMLGVIIIDIVIISKSFQLRKFYKVWYSLCALSDEFLWCFFADTLVEKGSQIGTALYYVPWYSYNPKLRKELLIPLAKARIAPSLKVGSIFKLSLSTFLVVSSQSSDVGEVNL